MTKSEFIEKYKIADAMPIDPSRRSLPAEGSTLAIAEFLNERFSGAISVELGAVSAQAVFISAEYLAYFFKQLVTEIYGRSMLKVYIETDGDNLTIRISSPDPVPIEEAVLCKLIKTARNAGFQVDLLDDTFLMYVPHSHKKIRRVYAISVMDSRRVMLGKFVEIFCHGELISTEPKPRKRTVNKRFVKKKMIK